MPEPRQTPDASPTVDARRFDPAATPVGRSLVGFKFVGVSLDAFQATNPDKLAGTGPTYYSATHEEVEKAARLAWGAFHTNQSRSNAERADLLELIAERIGELTQLLRVTDEETALGQTRLITERQRTAGNLRSLARRVRAGGWDRPVIEPGDASRKPAPRPDLRRVLRPMGPVAVFGASNFPLAYSTMGTDAGSALAAGCPVIVKGHPLHPGAGELVARAAVSAVHDLKWHPGTFAFLHAGGTREQAVGAELCAHPCVRAVGFTGSLAGGMALQNIAQQRPDPIPVFAEMGSVNPVVVLPTAAEERGGVIADKLASSMTAFVGQQCTRPGLVFLIRNEAGERFTRELADRINDTHPATMLAPRIRTRFAERLQILRRLEGVELRAGAITGEGPDTAQASPVLLRVRGETFTRHKPLHEEIFGPAAVLVVCDSEEDLVRALSVVVGSLTGSIFAEDFDAPLAGRVQAVLEQRVGRLIYNGVPTGVEVAEAMVHGGPWPATTQPWTTAVGPASMERWCRPVCYQNVPARFLPPSLRDAAPGRPAQGGAG